MTDAPALVTVEFAGGEAMAAAVRDALRSRRVPSVQSVSLPTSRTILERWRSSARAED